MTLSMPSPQFEPWKLHKGGWRGVTPQSCPLNTHTHIHTYIHTLPPHITHTQHTTYTLTHAHIHSSHTYTPHTLTHTQTYRWVHTCTHTVKSYLKKKREKAFNRNLLFTHCLLMVSGTEQGLDKVLDSLRKSGVITVTSFNLSTMLSSHSEAPVLSDCYCPDTCPKKWYYSNFEMKNNYPEFVRNFFFLCYPLILLLR